MRLLVFLPGTTIMHRSAATVGRQERVRPDLIVEDDCESIGGKAEMTFPQLPDELRRRIGSVVVPEFGGIDHLPDEAVSLR